jgi:2-oxoglutarate dehydrogenase E1 component
LGYNAPASAKASPREPKVTGGHPYMSIAKRAKKRAIILAAAGHFSGNSWAARELIRRHPIRSRVATFDIAKIRQASDMQPATREGALMVRRDIQTAARPPTIDGAEQPTVVGSLPFIEALWTNYEQQPEALSDEWRRYFQDWQFGQRTEGNGDGAAEGADGAATPAATAIADLPLSRPARRETATAVPPDAAFASRVMRMIAGYRATGHLGAKLDPLGRPRPPQRQLDWRAYGFDEADLDRNTASLDRRREVTLREVIAELQATYCGSVGYQLAHVEARARRWFVRRVERSTNSRLSGKVCRRILSRLVAAAGFEQFVRKRYVGAKTFSLAGAEAVVPLLDAAIEQAATTGVFEIVLGMAHRGRLNVLVNILGQRPRDLFRELEDMAPDRPYSGGDVRYHLGYSTDWLSARGERMHVSLSFNPSHLEFVNPVALGRMRAKQERAGDAARRMGMTLLLHGDASFAGEGVVQESLNLAKLPGYTTGGTVHVVIDNQIGFTTEPKDSRSTTYASDIAMAFGAPIMHVNGDDAEAVVRAARLAVQYRTQFAGDVVINLVCFRRWGHNESDEPAYTQPLMYRLIESQADAFEIYEQKLQARGMIKADAGRRMMARYTARLQSELAAAAHTRSGPKTSSLGGVWTSFVGGAEPADDRPGTGVPAERLKELLTKLIAVPEGFHLHSKLARGLAQRREMLDGKRPLDWATGEALALASLAVEGRPVRLTGQDTSRGTFSQRHAIWHDVENGSLYMPLANLDPRQAAAEVIDSPLCETAALGFEYGFSLDYPEALVAWEAQFGDFWNAAQVVFDQFIAAAEQKWDRLSGLVLLLPHGFEGQGPEHSSARLERFLVSAANHNYQVVVPSTPAQYFHCLRRQVIRRWRKPLVVLTPKSLLRHHSVVSSWEDLESGAFQSVIPDADERSKGTIKRVLLCMGKLYYELALAREEHARSDMALVRIEQFYPFPADELQRALASFPQQTPIVWCQEEPANMGAWHYLRSRWPHVAPERPPLVGITRPEAASPATGSHSAHRHEQNELVERALLLGEYTDAR